jgi:FXSXX-COOH protein
VQHVSRSEGEGDPEAPWAALIDVSGVSLSDLVAGKGDSALGRSIRRLVESLDDPNGVISAFSSFVE